jgi:hypothetical protein
VCKKELRIMTDQIKQRLSKTIKSYNDKKKNSKYLIYFNDTLDNELILNVTDGTECWQSNKLDISYLNRLRTSKTWLKSITKLDELLNHIDDSLRLGRFELNILESDLNKMELKILSNDNCNIGLSLELSSSGKTEIKNFLFSLYEKYNKLENEYNKIQSNRTTSNNKDGENNMASQSNDMMKRFNLSNGNNNSASNRKQGYSVINPLNKRSMINFLDDHLKSYSFYYYLYVI